MVPRPLGSLAASWELVPKSVQSIRPPACLTWAGPSREWKPLQKGGLTFANQRLSQSCWSGIPGPTRWRHSPATHLPGYPALPPSPPPPLWLAALTCVGSIHWVTGIFSRPLQRRGGLVVVVTWGHSVPCLSVFSGPPVFLLPLGMGWAIPDTWSWATLQGGHGRMRITTLGSACPVTHKAPEFPTPAHFHREAKALRGGGQQTYVLRVTSAS